MWVPGSNFTKIPKVGGDGGKTMSNKKNLYVILKVLAAMLNKVKKKKNLLNNVFELSIPPNIVISPCNQYKNYEPVILPVGFFFLHRQDLVCIFFFKNI